MAGIASKNLFELLGNDPELDPDRAPDPPTKAIDKPAARIGKRNTPAEPPVRDARASRGNTDGGLRNRGEGNQNRSRASGESGESGYRGRGGRGRGGRGRGGTPGDRHSRTGIAEHDKQAAHGWGGQTGGDEWADEKAGEAIAKDEKTEAVVNSGEAWDADAQPADPFAKEATDAGPAAEEELEDKTKSYTAWLAEQAEKKLSLGSIEVRQPNEGSNKKFPEGKPLSKEEEEAYMAGSGGKAKRERQRKEKTIVELDNERLHKEPADSGFRGGRGGRGGRGRGEGRGRGGRGRGEGRGDGGFRGGRGGRGGQGANAVNLADTSAFPSLGS